MIFSILLMDVIGITILYPVSTYIVRLYSDQALMATLLGVIYSAAQFLAAPALGQLSDRLGRRPVLLASVCGSAIGYVAFGVGGALWILFLSRLIDGITGGDMSTAAAYLADVSKPGERAENFGLIGVAWGAGLILGPALGAALGQFDLQAPAFVAAALSALNGLLVFFLLPESLPQERREPRGLRPRDLNPFVPITALARQPALGGLLLALCLFNFGFNGVNSTQTLFLIEKFAAQPWQIGLLLVLAGFTVTAVQALLVQRVVSRCGEQLVAITSLLGQAGSALAVFFAPAFWLIYPLTLVSSGVNTFTFPTVGALASNRVPENAQGALMGVTAALNSFMSILGPLWAGLAYDHVMRGAPYWMSAAVFMAAAALLNAQRAPRTVAERPIL